MTNVMTAKLASQTAPLFSPKPMATCERSAPATEAWSSFFRPIRCFFHQHLGNAHRRGMLQTSMRNMGGKVMNTFTTVMPSETYGPRSGSDFDKISLL